MKNIIKAFTLTLLFTLSLTSLFAQNANRIRIIFGTRSHPSADGKGCEGEKGICIIITTKDRDVILDNKGTSEISMNDEGKIVFNIIEDSSPAQEDENTLYLFERKEIPQEVCKELGYDRIVLQPGKYFLNKSDNSLGTAVIDAEIN
jgi:hypothetical protein